MRERKRQKRPLLTLSGDEIHFRIQTCVSLSAATLLSSDHETEIEKEFHGKQAQWQYVHSKTPRTMVNIFSQHWPQN